MTTQTTKPDKQNELANAMRWDQMVENAMLPGIHYTIAPQLLGCPTLPTRNYGARRSVEVYAQSRYNTVWKLPKPSVAERDIPLLSRVSIRSRANCPLTDRLVFTESLHEFEFWVICRTDCRVAEIREQPGPPLLVRDLTGKVARHHFDFLVIMTTGLRVAVAIKPEDHRRKADEAVAYCNKFHRGKLADKYVVRTRVNMSRRAVHNANLILWARRLRDEAHVRRMDSIAAEISEPVSMDLLWSEFGAHDDAFVACVNLIDAGKLEQTTPGIIEPGILVNYASQAELMG